MAQSLNSCSLSCQPEGLGSLLPTTWPRCDIVPVILAVKKERQEDQELGSSLATYILREFEAILEYMTLV